VANVIAGTLSVIDVATNAVTATIAIGGRPGDLAVVPAPRR
jgi:YVTN family beta-propeller protein